MKIVCLGDSLTYGFGVRRSRSWTKLAQEKSGMEIINEGICGDTSGGMLSRFQSAVSSQNPELVLIMGGVNDLIVGADLGTVKSNIMAMTHQAIAKYITPVIGIPTKIDLENVRQDWAGFSDFNRVAEELDKYQHWIKDFCKTFNVKYIDFYSEFEKEAGDEVGDLYIDGLHFNERGNEIIVEIFCRAIADFRNKKL
ncbi:MAG TPA: arylesterase [Clostridiales bacterium]|nr:arylesterase [Clostridiales bacterium]